MQQAGLNTTDRVGVMMKTGRGEGENATQLSQREKNLNWPIEES